MQRKSHVLNSHIANPGHLINGKQVQHGNHRNAQICMIDCWMGKAKIYTDNFLRNRSTVMSRESVNHGIYHNYGNYNLKCKMPCKPTLQYRSLEQKVGLNSACFMTWYSVKPLPYILFNLGTVNISEALIYTTAHVIVMIFVSTANIIIGKRNYSFQLPYLSGIWRITI